MRHSAARLALRAVWLAVGIAAATAAADAADQGTAYADDGTRPGIVTGLLTSTGDLIHTLLSQRPTAEHTPPPVEEATQPPSPTPAQSKPVTPKPTRTKRHHHPDNQQATRHPRPATRTISAVEDITGTVAPRLTKALAPALHAPIIDKVDRLLGVVLAPVPHTPSTPTPCDPQPEVAAPPTAPHGPPTDTPRAPAAQPHGDQRHRPTPTTAHADIHHIAEQPATSRPASPKLADAGDPTEAAPHHHPGPGPASEALTASTAAGAALPALRYFPENADGRPGTASSPRQDGETRWHSRPAVRPA